MPQTFLVTFRRKCKQGKRDRHQSKRLAAFFWTKDIYSRVIFSSLKQQNYVFYNLYLCFVFVTGKKGRLTFSNEKLESCSTTES